MNRRIPEKPMARPRATSASPKAPDPSEWPAFLLSQLGAHTTARFADRLAPLGLKPPPHVRLESHPEGSRTANVPSGPGP
jgi:hypothetical protein